MKTLHSAAIALVVLLAIFTQGSAFAKTAYTNSCNGTELPFNTAKKACKSGNYPGQTIVTCNNNGKVKDRRICNSDGEKKGVYIGNCAGSSTGYTNLKKACQSEDYFGRLLVKCKKGEEKSRMQCESAQEGDKKTAIFKGSCGSNEQVEGKNLIKACKNNPGETLVKCKKKKNVWKAKKTMFCQGNKDRFKFKKCSPQETETLISDYVLAESRVDTVLAELENELQTNQSMSRKLRNKMEKVRKKLEKIQTAMDRPRTYVCKANKNLCAKATAHTLPGGKKVKVCDYYFGIDTAIHRASVLVHEISHHKTQTSDKGESHLSCSDPYPFGANTNFQNHAAYYEYIAKCGLYVPN